MATTANKNSRINAVSWRRVYDGVVAVTATWDPASVASKGSAIDTITVPGLALGDIVLGVSFSLDLAAILLGAYVSAANTLTVYLTNNTAGAVDLASGTIRAVVAKPGALFAEARA